MILIVILILIERSYYTAPAGNGIGMVERVSGRRPRSPRHGETFRTVGEPVYLPQFRSRKGASPSRYPLWIMPYFLTLSVPRVQHFLKL